ncbi:MAG TPA: hypothetical protein VJX67_20870 [Blastocatellia bacterium]|nr:hypothetical protein [Blastocatellia bacterium]
MPTNPKDPDLFSGLILLIAFAVLGVGLLHVTWNHRRTVKFQVKLFLCALGLRFMASAIIYQFGLINVIKDEDGGGWAQGLGYYTQWIKKGVGLFDLPGVLMGAFGGGEHQRGYGYMVGTLFYITGTPARLPAAVLNCFVGALTVVLAYRIARCVFSEWVAVRVGWWTCVLPSMLIWSSQTLKEPAVIFLETVVMYGCVQLKKNGFSSRHIVMCGLAIILVLPFRFYAAYVAAAAVALSLVLPQFGKRKMSIGSAIGLAVLVVPMVMMSGVLVSSEAQIEKFDLKQISNFRRDVAVGAGSGVTSSFDLTSPVGLAEATAVGGAYLMLAPFPWQLGGGSARMLLTTPELIVWWWLFFAGVLPGLWYGVKYYFNEVVPLLLFLMGLGLLYSAMFGNVGLAYRQRAQLMPWLLVFAMVGLEQRMLKKSLARRSKKEHPVLGARAANIRHFPARVEPQAPDPRLNAGSMEVDAS